MEKIYNIPLKKAYQKSRSSRANYAGHMVKEFLKKHMDAESVKIGENLNQYLWKNGLKNPPRSVRVFAVTEEKDGKNIVKAELEGHEYVEFKPKKIEEKGMAEKLKEKVAGMRGSPKSEKVQELEDKIEGKEKASGDQTKTPQKNRKEKVSPDK